MSPATKTLLEVLAISARGIVCALERAVDAFSKWVKAQEVQEISANGVE